MPFPIRRMAITVPPAGWFHGVAQALFDRYRQALVDLGIALFDVPVDMFLPPDAARIATLIEELRTFRPEFAFGLPHGSYALLCRLPATRDGRRANVFLDVLDVPTICLWDHAPVELADQLLSPHPAGPAQSSAGAIDSLRSVLGHPRLIHWSRDNGQTRIMGELGFLESGQLITEMPPVLTGFEPAAPRPAPASDREPHVAFVGRVYQNMPPLPDSALASLADEVNLRFVDTFATTSFWSRLRDAIDAMPVHVRAHLALDMDQRYFWRFAHQLTCHQAQTAFRLALLGAAGVPVACYGNLRVDMPGAPSTLVPIPTDVPYGPALSRLFARHPITIDVMSPGFVTGYSHKQVHGFASGGFMLITWKQDFVDTFGDAGAAVSFTGPRDLADKVEQFLSNPGYRAEVGDAIRAIVADRFQLRASLARALSAAHQWRTPSAGNRARAARTTSVAASSMVMNLLPALKSDAHWSGASVEHGGGGALVTTSPDAWAYAAAIALPKDVRGMDQPHVSLCVVVDTGRIGVALVDRHGAVLSEQVVSAGRTPTRVIVEVPCEGKLRIILRNTVAGPSRARVLDAHLCDRLSAE